MRRVDAIAVKGAFDQCHKLIGEAIHVEIGKGIASEVDLSAAQDDAVVGIVDAVAGADGDVQRSIVGLKQIAGVGEGDGICSNGQIESAGVTVHNEAGVNIGGGIAGD